MNRLSPATFLLIALLCNAGANILIKYSATRRSTEVAVGEGIWARVSPWLDPYLLAGMALFGLNLMAYSVALRTFRISVAYPVMITGGYCLILLAGWFIFRERLTVVQYSGIGVVLTGMWMILR